MYKRQAHQLGLVQHPVHHLHDLVADLHPDADVHSAGGVGDVCLLYTSNMLANGQILVQRFGDILDGKRTWQKELAQSNIRPTLPDAVAGDITAAMPYRAMTNIINFIQAMDRCV